MANASCCLAQPQNAMRVSQALSTVQVVPVFAGGLDFSAPVKKFFYDPIYKSTAFVDCIISLTG